MRTLRSVEVLKSLSVRQLQRLSDVLTEISYKPGEHVITQGEEGDTFYIISEGHAIVTKTDKNQMPYGKQIGEISEGQYFGERALLKHEPRAANVIATPYEESMLRCL
jgi:CRP-like cAMP-binding protein